MVERAINSVIVGAKDLLGPRGIVEDASDIAPWLTDWRGRFHGEAAAIFEPASTADVAAIVALCARYRVPLVPQGGNTSMVGGATPPPDGSALILSLRRMNQIRAIEAAANIVVAEAGVILSTLHDAAAAVSRRFPLSLGAKGSATVGGLVSTNAGGTQVLRFGTMRSLVLGVEAVLPDGSIYNGLAALKKDNRGYDLDQLLVGAEGTLGIVTAATLRLVSAITDRAVAWVGIDHPATALTLLRLMESKSDNRIESFEILPAESLEAVLAHIPGTRPPLRGAHPWHLLIEYVGLDAAESLAALLQTDLIEDATISANEAQAEAFWRIRDSISEAERATGPAMQHDISVPVDSMPSFMIDAARALETAFPGVHASAFGHLGDGNVHFHVRAPAGAEASAWRRDVGEAASRMVHDLVTEAGGSISAEHGIGQMKRDELIRLSTPAHIATLRAIKHALDPLNIMNPGKLV